MTTGRINQVTILSPCTRSAQADRPKAASCTKQGDAEATQVAALEAPKAPTAQATDSIAPTEFPKEQSATGNDWCYHRIHFRYIGPSGGENLHRVTHVHAETRQGGPQRSDEYLAKPAIHKPQMMPAKRIDRTSVPYTSANWEPKVAASLTKYNGVAEPLIARCEE